MARRLAARLPEENKEQLRERWLYVVSENMYYHAAGQYDEHLILHYIDLVEAALRASH
jgi:hypothetical protein